MASIESLTLEVPDPTAAGAFYTAAFGLGNRVALRASEAPTTGFRDFTLSLVVSQPATVDGLIGAALGAGATPLKTAKKGLWGYGGVVRAPDGTIWKVADVVEEGHRPGHSADRRRRPPVGSRGRRGEQAVLRRPRPGGGEELRP